MALRSLELFAGGGGLALGLEACGAHTVCFVERDAYAAAVLAARMEDARLAPAPVWSDVQTFDGRPWRGVVDLVAGGFPCQDISNAGNRVGIGGERSGLWSHFARIVGEVGPRLVFVENVAALASRGLDVVLGDLASLGFDAEWGCLGADDAGAPHGRERLFILAHAGPVAYGLGLGREGLQPDGPAQGAVVGGRGGEVAHAEGSGSVHVRGGRRDQDKGWADLPDHSHPGEGLADSNERGRGLVGLVGLVGLRDRIGPRGGNDPNGRRGRAPWPPGPRDAEGWRDYLEQWPGLEPAIRRGADGMAQRVDRLRVLGNGVVPDQAALAWRVLWERLMSKRGPTAEATP